MITRLKNALHGFRLGWLRHTPVNGRRWEPSWLPPGTRFMQESGIHPHVAAERADLFLGQDIGSTEIETLNWLHATVCLTKASCILETGAAEGLGTIALASACRDNGFGVVHSVELDPGLCARLETKLRRLDLSRYAQVHCASSFDFLAQTDLVFDFGFFDSLCEIRAEEYLLCRKRGLLKGVAAFHDTSPTRTQTLTDSPPASVHQEYRRKIYELVNDPAVSGSFENTLSRGLFVIFPKPTLE